VMRIVPAGFSRNSLSEESSVAMSLSAGPRVFRR
jgi:hypothetical protein